MKKEKLSRPGHKIKGPKCKSMWRDSVNLTQPRKNPDIKYNPVIFCVLSAVGDNAPSWGMRGSTG